MIFGGGDRRAIVDHRQLDGDAMLGCSVGDDARDVGHECVVRRVRHRADVDPRRRCRRHHVHLRRLAGVQHRRGDPHVAEVRMGAVPCLHVTFEDAERGDRGGGRTVRVVALERHRAVRHLAVEVEPQAQRPFGDVTDLAAFGLATDHGVDALGVASASRSPWRRSSCLLRRRARRAPSVPGTDPAADGIGGEQHRRQPALHVGRAAAPQPAVGDRRRRTGRRSRPPGRPR